MWFFVSFGSTKIASHGTGNVTDFLGNVANFLGGIRNAFGSRLQCISFFLQQHFQYRLYTRYTFNQSFSEFLIISERKYLLPELVFRWMIVGNNYLAYDTTPAPAAKGVRRTSTLPKPACCAVATEDFSIRRLPFFRVGKLCKIEILQTKE